MNPFSSRKPAVARWARLLVIIIPLAAFPIFACGFGEFVTPDPITAATLTELAGTQAVLAATQAAATAVARATAFAGSRIKPLGPPLTILDAHLDLHHLAFSPDGRLLASINSTTVVLWDVTTRELLDTLDTGEPAKLGSLAFSPAGSLLAAGSYTACDQRPCPGQIYVWDVLTRKMRSEPLIGHEGEVTSLAFSPDGLRLASVGADGSLVVWDLIAGSPIDPPPPVTGRVFSAAFAPDGNQLALGQDGSITVWDVDQRELVTTINPIEASGEFNFVGIGPDGAFLIASDWRSLTYSLDYQNSELVGHSVRPAYSFAASPDYSLLASGQPNDVVYVTDNLGLYGYEVPLSPAAAGSTVVSIAFSPDGRVLAAVGDGGASIYLLDLTTGFDFGAPAPPVADSAAPAPPRTGNLP